MSHKRDRKLAEAIAAQQTTRQVRMMEPPPAEPPDPCPDADADCYDGEKVRAYAQVLDALDALKEQADRLEGFLKVIVHHCAETNKRLAAVSEPEEPSLIHKP